MGNQRAPDPPEIHFEDPVFLVILTESGLVIFSYSFEEAQQWDEHLIGGLLTALATLGQNALATSGTIDCITY